MGFRSLNHGPPWSSRWSLGLSGPLLSTRASRSWCRHPTLPVPRDCQGPSSSGPCLSYAEPLAFSLEPSLRWQLTCPPSGPSASSVFGNLGGPSGWEGLGTWSGWAGWPLARHCASPDIALTHNFINFPKVLPLSGQFSQRPRCRWPRLGAGCWTAWSQPRCSQCPCQLLPVPACVL